jgi:hypothetical protein
MRHPGMECISFTASTAVGRRIRGFGRENGRFGIEDLLSYRAVHGA